MNGLIERLKGVQMRGNTHPRDAFLLEEMRERIHELEAEVKRLQQPLSIVDQETGEQLHPDSTITHRVADVMALMQRTEAAEAKLEAIEGLQRYVVDDSIGIYTTCNVDGDWIKAADVQAILRGESGKET